MKSHSKKDVPGPARRPNETTQKAIKDAIDGNVESYGSVEELINKLSS